MLRFFAAPSGLVPENWSPSPQSVDYITTGMEQIEQFDLGVDAETETLRGLLETPLKPLVPLDGESLDVPAAAQVDRQRQVILLSEIAAGPWSIAFPDNLIEVMGRALREAYAREDNLLILRTRNPS